jgi:hypothetical protein
LPDELRPPFRVGVAVDSRSGTLPSFGSASDVAPFSTIVAILRTSSQLSFVSFDKVSVGVRGLDATAILVHGKGLAATTDAVTGISDTDGPGGGTDTFATSRAVDSEFTLGHGP